MMGGNGEEVIVRKLHFTTGSPFARAVRIVLAEKGLDYEKDETVGTTAPDVRSRFTPTLQVPTLEDGGLVLWDSAVIIDYLVATYPNAKANAGERPFAEVLVRPDHAWQDKLALATLQTLGGAITTVSQLLWSGIRPDTNGFAERSAIRVPYLLDWCETQIASTDEGFVPGRCSVQDVLLACHCLFAERRPLGLEWEAASRPKVTALVRRLERRKSFFANPIPWWEPGVSYATPEEWSWALEKTIHKGMGWDAFSKARARRE